MFDFGGPLTSGCFRIPVFAPSLETRFEPNKWLPKNTVLQIVLSRFLNGIGLPRRGSKNSLHFVATCLRSTSMIAPAGKTSPKSAGDGSMRRKSILGYGHFAGLDLW